MNAFKNYERQRNADNAQEGLDRLSTLTERCDDIQHETREIRDYFFRREIFELAFPDLTLGDLKEIMAELFLKSDPYLDRSSPVYEKMQKIFDELIIRTMPGDKKQQYLRGGNSEKWIKSLSQ